jgi:hypothetical protein
VFGNGVDFLNIEATEFNTVLQCQHGILPNRSVDGRGSEARKKYSSGAHPFG